MFCLGQYEYASKEDLKAKLRSFLETAPDGPVTHPVAIDKLHCLLLLHPHVEEKIGSGIRQFIVARNELGSGKGFKIVRTDGTEERFSYKVCIDGQIVTNRFKVIEALRFAVRSQLVEFRRTLILPTVCAITGHHIASNAELHIDHKTPFWSLVREFCRQYSVDINGINTVGNGEHLQLADENLQSQFQQFHRSNAVLQPSWKEANLEKGARLEP